MNKVRISARYVAGLALFVAGCGGGGRSLENLEGVITPLSLEPPPVYALLGARAELNLTSVQVATLDSIAEAYRVEIRPLEEELEAVSGADRMGAYRIKPEGKPILESIQAKQRQAGESVASTLTEEQRATVCRLFSQTPGGGRGGPQGGRGGARVPPPGRMPPDSAAFGRQGRPQVWNWCAPPPPPDGAPSPVAAA